MLDGPRKIPSRLRKLDAAGKTASVKKLSECLQRINSLGIDLTDMTVEMLKCLPEELIVGALGKIDNCIIELSACIDESRRRGAACKPFYEQWKEGSD